MGHTSGIVQGNMAGLKLLKKLLFLCVPLPSTLMRYFVMVVVLKNYTILVPLLIQFPSGMLILDEQVMVQPI